MHSFIHADLPWPLPSGIQLDYIIYFFGKDVTTPFFSASSILQKTRQFMVSSDAGNKIQISMRVYGEYLPNTTQILLCITYKAASRKKAFITCSARIYFKNTPFNLDVKYVVLVNRTFLAFFIQVLLSKEVHNNLLSFTSLITVEIWITQT